MSDKKKLLSGLIISLVFASAIVLRMHSNEISKELTTYISPFMSPLLTISIVIFSLGFLIVKNRNKIRDIDNLNTKDMIYIAFLILGFCTVILLIVIGLFMGTI